MGDDTMPEHKKKYVSMKFEKNEMYKTPWNRLSEEEKQEIIEKSKIRKEEEDRKKNRKIADIILGRQRTVDNSWEQNDNKEFFRTKKKENNTEGNEKVD